MIIIMNKALKELNEMPVPTDPFSISALFTAMTAGSTAWLWYDRKRRDKRLDDHGKELRNLRDEQMVHKTKFIDETKARGIVKDEISSLKESHIELKTMVSNLGSQVQQVHTAQQVQTEILKNLLEQTKKD